MHFLILQVLASESGVGVVKAMGPVVVCYILDDGGVLQMEFRVALILISPNFKSFIPHILQSYEL